jgi:hypothetical protein
VETEDEIVEIEDALVELLECGEAWDGHAMHASSRDVSILTPDARDTFARVEPFLVRAGLIDHVTASARPLADDRFVILWPRDESFGK